jgi:hypothetical protein
MKANGTGRAFGMGRLLLALATGVLLGACGGGSGSGDGGSDPGPSRPSFQNNPNRLGANEAIVVRFGTSVNPGSLSLGGALATHAEDAEDFQWSPDNSQVAIQPATDSYWQPIGETRTFSATATASSGGSLTASDDFRVLLRFDGGGGFTALEPVVVGQSALSDESGDPAVFASPLGNPAALPVGGTSQRLYFPDGGNDRVLGLTGIPQSNVDDESAFFPVTEPEFSGPRSVTATQQTGILLVANTGGHQILGYNPAPGAAVSDAATITIGTGTAGCSASQLRAPESVFLSETGWLFVADTGNNRVLIWEDNPEGSGPPTYILGQAGDEQCDPNRGSTATRATLSAPTGVWADGDHVVVTDRGNSRVLVWNIDASFSTGAEADVILGQGSGTLSSVDVPAGVTSNGTQLFVSDNVDGAGKGVLVWNTFPDQDNEPAYGLLGPGDDVGRANFSAGGLLLVEDRLVLGQPENNRYLIFQSQ